MMRARTLLLLALVLNVCDSCVADAAAETGATPVAATRLGALTRGLTPQGFKLATEVVPFDFPRDHGPHPDFRHEWWYVTGHLDAATGERFGFELTFFRFAMMPPTAANVASGAGPADQLAIAGGAPPPTAASASAWRTRQIYMAHFAVTDLDRRTFFASQSYARDALGLAGAQATPFRVWLRDWSLGESAAMPASASAGSPPWQLHAQSADYILDLDLRALTQPVLNGEAGLSRKADVPGAASYYYSLPRLEARGRVTRSGKPLEVKGMAWLDREWGSGALGPDQQGWDWFALQLDDGSALMFYALRKRDGRPDAHSAGTWVAADGTVRALSSRDVQIEANDYWDSPRGGRYPARWRMRVPSLALDLSITPRLADQELPTNPRYWEGAATISGSRNAHPATGRAYVELVGYARSASTQAIAITPTAAIPAAR